MARLRLSRRARADLLEIWKGIARENPSAADVVLAGIERRIALLRMFPAAGRPRPEFGHGARSISVGRIVILYRLDRAGAHIVRVVPGMRDLRRIAVE